MPRLSRRLAAFLASILIAAGLASQSEGIGVRRSGSGGYSTLTYTNYPRTFWVVGCIHVGAPNGGVSPKNWFQLSALVDSLNVARAAGRCDFLLVAGDWAEDGIQLNPERSDTLMAIRGRANFPIWFGLGNHEAVPADTLAGRSPYYTAMLRFPQLYPDGKEYWSRDTDFFRVVFLQNNANFDVSNPNLDYRVNNPAGYAAPGGTPGLDYNGIGTPQSPQRAFLAERIATIGGRHLVVVGHRPVYGSNVNTPTRLNYGKAARGTGYIRAIEQALPPGRRALNVVADQHVFMLTEAMNDSHLCAAGESGLYHLQQISGFGLRQVDTTSVLPAPNQVYKSYVGLKVNDASRLTARTSKSIIDTTTVLSDPDLAKAWLCTEVQAWGDQWLVRTYRVWTGNSPSAKGYNGAGHLVCIDERLLTMDNYKGPPTQIHDTEPPTVAVTAPNGGQTWATGSQQAITWTADDDRGVLYVDLEYSTNAGSTWSTIATSEVNDGTYTWTVPGLPTTQGRVRVTAWDAADNSASDISDANFTIADQVNPTVTLLSPNGGQDWAMGSQQSITWTATDNVVVSSITLEYSTTGTGGTYTTIATGEANDGSYTWTLPNVASFNVAVRVKAIDSSGNIGSDVSDTVLSIRDITAPTVTVLSPNGGETWTSGTQHDITWTATDNVGVTSITVAYKTDPGATIWTPIATGEANDGVYTWTIPSSTATWAKVRIRAIDAGGNVGIDSSDAPLSLSDPYPPATITDLAAASGSVSSIDLSWTAPGDDSTDGTADSYDLRYSTSPIRVRGRMDIVGNGTYTPDDGVHLSGNYAQAVAFGGSNYAPSAAAALLQNQAHPMFHCVQNGSPSITTGYMAALSAVCGATYQNTPTNGSFNISTISDPSDNVPGGYGKPTGPGGITNGVAWRLFDGAEVFVNLTTSSKTIPFVDAHQTAEAGQFLAANTHYVEILDQQSRAPGKYPQKGGLYWGNLTVTAIGNLADWDDIVLNDANVNGPTDGDTHIPATPKARIDAIRHLNPTAKLGLSVNGLNIFVDGSGNPSAYWPMQIRMYHKAKVLSAWIYENGIPKEQVLPWGRVRFVDFSNQSFRTWLAADIDSTLESCGMDYLFIDELRDNISDLRNGNNTYPSDAVWTAAMNDLMDRVEAGISAPQFADKEPPPSVAGVSDAMTVDGLQPRTWYFFGMRTADEAGNISALSNVAGDSTLGTNPSSWPMQRSFVTYDGGSDISSGVRSQIAAYAPKYIDGPRDNDAAWFAANAPSSFVLRYNSLSDDYCLSHAGSDTSEFHYKKVNAVANGCADSEEPWLHFWNDTPVTLEGQTVWIKGYGGPGGTATSKAEARLSVYYADRSRAFCNFSTAAARLTHRKWITSNQLTSTWRGIWFDNAFSRFINVSVPSPYLAYPSVTSSGGTFTAGTYYHAITAVTPQGETGRSSAYPITVGTSGTILLDWSDFAGATAYKVYRSTTGDFSTGSLLVATVTASQYTDTGSATTTGNVRAGLILEESSHSKYLGTTQFYDWHWYSGAGLALKEWRQWRDTAPAELAGNPFKIGINVANIPWGIDPQWRYDYVTLGNPGSTSNRPADVVFTEFQEHPLRPWGQDYPSQLYDNVKAASDGGTDVWWTGWASGIGPYVSSPTDTTAGVTGCSGGCSGTYTVSEWMQSGLALYWLCRSSGLYLTGWAGTNNYTWTPIATHWQTYNFKAGWSVDLGQPVAGANGIPHVLQSGTDPNGKAYKVWGREFENGYALVRMRGNYDEHIDASGTGVTVTLPMTLKPVLINGTIAASGVSSVSVRNGQGWVFRK